MVPPTRASLLVRIRESTDSDAWEQFVFIYGPIVFNFAKRLSLQDADAADLVQDVLNEVTNSIGRFNYDPTLGKFRSWLFKVANRIAIRIKQRQKNRILNVLPQGEIGDTPLDPRYCVDPEEAWETEYQRKIFSWAAEQIKPSFHPKTWEAFWQTAVEGEDPKQVASKLEMNIGSVYVARNRITKRLTQKIREVDDSI